MYNVYIAVNFIENLLKVRSLVPCVKNGHTIDNEDDDTVLVCEYF